MRGGTEGTAVLALLVALLVAASSPAVAGGATAPAAATLSLVATPMAGGAPLTVDFVANLTPSSTAAQFNWTFGDGSTYQQSATGSSTPVHQYTVPGRYLVEVTAQTTSAGWLESNLVVTVDPAALSAQIDVIGDTGPAPLTVQFGAAAFGGTGTYPWFNWSFGDGQYGSGLRLNYTYAVPGTYTVNLTVTDSAGHEAVAVEGIYVDPPAGKAASGFALTPQQGLLVATIAVAIAALVAVAIGGSQRSRWKAAAGSSLGVPPGARADRPTPRAAPLAGRAAAGRNLPSEEARDAYERILTQLYWSGHRTGGPVGRVEATREGLARELRIAPSTAGRALRRLIQAGAVVESLEHVPGAPRRVWCYSLTPLGESAARGLQPPAPDTVRSS